MKAQKFHRGDLVHIAADLGAFMSHFESDQDAIVMGSYDDQYGGGDTGVYTVMFTETGGECSWYYERQLEFIRHVDEAEITRIKEARKQRDEQESQLPWIVEHWNKSPSGATCDALMKAIGISEPWGKHGEGITWYSNWLVTWELLDDALDTHDLTVVQHRIEAIRAATR